jgi:hypothetical protein
MVLSALAEGLDPSAAERVFGFRQATITSLSDSCRQARAHPARVLLLPSSPPTLAAGRTTNTAPKCQPDSLALAGHRPHYEASSRSSSWPRTQKAAHSVIHSLQPLLAPGCLPVFTSDGLNVYFYALTAHCGPWRQERRRGRNVRRWQV